MIFLEENPGRGTDALAVPLVESRGIIHEHNDLAVVGHGFVHGSSERSGSRRLGCLDVRRGRKRADGESGQHG